MGWEEEAGGEGGSGCRSVGAGWGVCPTARLAAGVGLTSHPTVCPKEGTQAVRASTPPGAPHPAIQAPRACRSRGAGPRPHSLPPPPALPDLTEQWMCALDS